MQQQAETASRRARLSIGAVFLAVGLGMMVLITVSPEGLNAPYWVAIVAAAAFAFAGASTMVQALGWDLGGRLLALGAVVCLATPGLWILFDPAEKHCTSSVGFAGGSVTTGAGDIMCRAVFGFGGAITLAIAVFAVVAFVRRARRRPKPDQRQRA